MVLTVHTQLFARTIRHAMDCDNLGKCIHQHLFKLSLQEVSVDSRRLTCCNLPTDYVLCVKFRQDLVLDFACVMLYAGNSSAGQLKDAAPACGARFAEIFPTFSLSALLALFSSLLSLSFLFKHIRICSIHRFEISKGRSDAPLDMYTYGAADWPCGRAEPRLKRSRHHSDS